MALRGDGVEIAIAQFNIAGPLIQIGFFCDDVYCARYGVLAKQSALRAAQNLYPFNVNQLLIEVFRPDDVNPVNVETDARFKANKPHQRGNPADTDQPLQPPADTAGLARIGDEAEHFIDAVNASDIKRFCAQSGYCNRHIRDVFVALSGGDDDLTAVIVTRAFSVWSRAILRRHNHSAQRKAAGPANDCKFNCAVCDFHLIPPIRRHRRYYDSKIAWRSRSGLMWIALFCMVFARMVHFDWNNIEKTAEGLLGADEPEWYLRSPQAEAWRFPVSRAKGKGWLEYYSFDEGLNVLAMDSQFDEPAYCQVEDGENLRFNFALTLDVEMQAGATRPTHALTQSWRVINTRNDLEMKEHFAANHRLSWVTVHCPPSLLAELAGKNAGDLPEMLQPLPEWYSGTSFNSPFESDRQFSEIVSDILACELEDNLRLQYIKARATELLCLALHSLLEPPRSAPGINLTVEEETAIRAIAERLRREFANPPSVAALAKEAGVNRNKLFYGFRNFYGVTISRYLQNLRLERGYELLKTTDLSLLEICEQAGFLHQSNFSTAISKRFGMSPKELRKRRGSDWKPIAG